MNKSILLFLLLFPFLLFADLYDEAMRYEARGEYELFTKNLTQYFNENINNDNQEDIINKLLYSSTLLESSDKTIGFLLKHVRYQSKSESRQILYIKVANLYELLGNIYDAGIYYEKAAYVNKKSINYLILFNSIEMLLELGYLELCLNKISNISINELEEGLELDSYYLLLSRIYYMLQDIEKAKSIIKLVQMKDSRYYFLANILGILTPTDLNHLKSLDLLVIKDGNYKMRNPSDFIGVSSEITDLNISTTKNSEIEICLGVYRNKSDAAGIINILEQIPLSWFFDYENSEYTLYIFTANRKKTEKKLQEFGIGVKDK